VSRTPAADPIAPAADIEGLEALWQDGLAARFSEYLDPAAQLGNIGPQVALAAALVETALILQRLGGPAVESGPLLLADLCLARASRLLADSQDQRLQAGFAGTVERAAAAAAALEPVEPVRPQLLSVISA
jgi:hypothetical protein